MTEFKKLFDAHLRLFRLMFEVKREIAPQWILQNSKGEVTPIVSPFTGAESKNLVDGFIRQLIQEHGYVRYVMCSEVWASPTASDDRPPSERPDREEFVMLIGEDKTGESGFALAPIHRLGDKPELGGWEIQHEGFTGRRFVGMFSQSETKH